MPALKAVTSSPPHAASPRLREATTAARRQMCIAVVTEKP
jgi:hypothetical protein